MAKIRVTRKQSFQIGDLIRGNWKAHAYINGMSDAKIAERIGHPATERLVATIRGDMGPDYQMLSSSGKPFGRFSGRLDQLVDKVDQLVDKVDQLVTRVNLLSGKMIDLEDARLVERLAVLEKEWGIGDKS